MFYRCMSILALALCLAVVSAPGAGAQSSEIKVDLATGKVTPENPTVNAYRAFSSIVVTYDNPWEEAGEL